MMLLICVQFILLSIILSCIKSQDQAKLYDNYKEYNSFGLLISNKYDFYDYTNYGNELQQANEYFSYIDRNPIYRQSEIESYRNYYSCFSYSLQRAGNCMVKYNLDHENITPFSKNYAMSYSNNALTRSLDCDYDVNLYQIIHKHDKYYIKFNINEHNCKSNLSMSSGSSFDSYALTEKSLVACKQYSLSNSSFYDIVCVFLENNFDQSTNSKNCVNLTVILKGMNFDNFNEYTVNQYRRYFRIISNNIQYCDDIKYLDLVKTTNDYTSLSNIWYYTGEWLSHKSIKSISYTPSYNDSLIGDTIIGGAYHISAFEYYSKFLKVELVYSSRTFGNFPETSKSLYYSQYYKYYPIILLPYSNISETSIQFNHLNETMKSYLKNPKNMRYFLGSSHMRYNYYLLVDYLYGDQVNVTVEKDLDELFFNLYNFGNRLPRALFADDQADFLLELCNQFDSNYSSDVYQTITFQTGAWDLRFQPLGRLLRDFPGTKLITAVSKILSGEVSCGNLHHFIWMTSVPYRTDFFDDNSDFEHRNDASISALNEFYLKHLMKIKVIDKIKFTIIDSYSITKPRLILNQYNEIVCKNHYTCLRRDEPIDKTKIFIIHTPAGDAVLQTLLLALSTR